MPLEPAQLLTLAEHHTAAWCSGDPARVAAFFAPEGSLRINTGPPAVGRDAIRAVAEGFMTAFPDMAVFLDAVETAGESAIYRWTLTGTNAANGRKVRISGFEVWRFGPGALIAESEGHFDEADYQRQLGGG